MSNDDPFHHVRDSRVLELPGGYTPELPTVFGFELTKFMLLQVVAAGLVLFIFTGLARRVRQGGPTRGRFWNFWEAMALYIRDEVVRPTIGDPHHHDHGDDDHGHQENHSALPTGGHPADKYLPFIWSCFFFVMFCNLLGAIPSLGSATGNINVTGALAIVCLVVTFISGVQVMGVGGFFGNLVPATGVSGPGGVALAIMLFLIEGMGFLIKHAILALRLFGNMLGGHTAIGVLLGFIAAAANEGFGLWTAVSAGSIAAQIGIGMLELLVAVLQAYVFAFLATIFIAGAVHKH